MDVETHNRLLDLQQRIEALEAQNQRKEVGGTIRPKQYLYLEDPDLPNRVRRLSWDFVGGDWRDEEV